MSASRPAAAPVPADLPSYKLRRGRMSAARRAALAAHAERFAVPAGDGPLDLAALFGPGTPVVLEVGFGMGETTLAMAAADPGTGLLAADVHTPGVAALLQGLAERGLEHVRVVEDDARRLLRRRLAPGSLAGVRVFFPDPWPKPRHHKRRLLDAAFTALVAERLAPGGLLHVATDWEPYAERVAGVLAAEPGLVLEEVRHEPPPWRPRTRFEARGLARGHVVTDLLARRPPHPAPAPAPAPAEHQPRGARA
ncbi:tRNA (guanosine(46)-N7)-methyltransferase TrmB [Kineococcus sp. SYSU DK004]|uniref:tRNA (guanosine(46)-N7)-methyltransferase TrmB n=1 Tax=Kineococcus sp. SYSU DK004 TaxID=3383125 RepID=UPI003D7EEE45